VFRLQSPSQKALADGDSVRAALIGTAAADRLLDRIESRDARQRLAGDRRGAALGDVVEATSQMNLMWSST
jgi:hypothetical protein